MCGVQVAELLTWLVWGGGFLCVKLGVVVGGTSCASNLVCVWGAPLVACPWYASGGALVCLGVDLSGRRPLKIINMLPLSSSPATQLTLILIMPHHHIYKT